MGIRDVVSSGRTARKAGDAVVRRQAVPPGTPVPPGTQVAVDMVEPPVPPPPGPPAVGDAERPASSGGRETILRPHRED
ncbi:hypothetical protein HH310_31735 [Actinoplanes sp. TBRC 11911]|uniref:hypothetical protein n=1 Tax=Actinoplanes sp. TBRC 11911 TaxID=2729386 RepID=UPI00145D41A5|nr:hypothetical protein [Actinoplanes sp. TBRC 11911]NMO55742.1 hypothetical protein [Actinoplanes sp. TBRC 11911]